MKIGHVIDEGEALEIRDGLRALVKFREESFPISDAESFTWEQVTRFALEMCAGFLDARVWNVSQEAEIKKLKAKK